MLLAMIQIVSDLDKMLRGRCHFITRFYEDLLPRFYLDGCSKLVIHADKIRADRYFYDDFDGVSEYYLPADFRDLLLSAENCTGELLNSIIFDVLTDIADMSPARDDPDERKEKIKAAYEFIEESNFEYRKQIKKLSRVSPCRRYKAVVEMRLGQHIGETWMALIYERKSMTLLYSDVINKVGSSIDRRDLYHHSLWNDNVYAIYDIRDRLEYKIEIK